MVTVRRRALASVRGSVGAGRGSCAGTAIGTGRSVFIWLGRARRAEGSRRCPGRSAFAALSGPSRPSKFNAAAGSGFTVYRGAWNVGTRFSRQSIRWSNARASVRGSVGAGRGSCAGTASDVGRSVFIWLGRARRAEGPRRCPGRSAFAAHSDPSRPSKFKAAADSGFDVYRGPWNAGAPAQSSICPRLSRIGPGGIRRIALHNDQIPRPIRASSPAELTVDPNRR